MTEDGRPLRYDDGRGRAFGRWRTGDFIPLRLEARRKAMGDGRRLRYDDGKWITDERQGL